MPTDLVKEFEALYLAFLRAGGFAQPCPSEDWERLYRTRRVGRWCRHGLPEAVCAYCQASTAS